jgi:hypothetical protein
MQSFTTITPRRTRYVITVLQMEEGGAPFCEMVECFDPPLYTCAVCHRQHCEAHSNESPQFGNRSVCDECFYLPVDMQVKIARLAKELNEK